MNAYLYFSISQMVSHFVELAGPTQQKAVRHNVPGVLTENVQMERNAIISRAILAETVLLDMYVVPVTTTP